MIWRSMFARFKVNQRRVYSHILVKVCAVAMAMGLIKNKVKKKVFCLFKKIAHGTLKSLRSKENLPT